MAELLRKQQQVIAVGIEPTYATPANPTGAKAVLAQDLTVKMLEAQTQGRNNINGIMGSQGSITVSRNATASFGVEFAPNAVVTTPPAWGELLRICGMAEVIDVDSVSYTPVSAGFESASLLYRIGLLQQNLLGSRGKFVLNLDKGTIPSIKFDITSLYEAPTKELTDLSGIDTSAYEVPVGVTKDSVAVCTFLGVTVAMSKLTVDPGIGVKFIDDVGSQSAEIENRSGKLNITFRTDEQTLINQINNASTNATGAFAFQLGSDVGKRLKVDVPQIQVSKSDVVWEGEFAYCSVDCDIVPNAKNNDLIITQY